MVAIEIDSVCANRYAPEGVEPGRLYKVGDSSGLSLGQLMAAVCVQRGALLETRSVARMNMMTQNNAYLEAMANVCSQLAGGAALSAAANLPAGYAPKKVSAGCSVRAFLVDECGVAVSQSESATLSYNERLALIAGLKTKMDGANTTSQEDAIELQSLINWRDVTFNASSSMMGRYGNTGMNMANNI